MEVVEYLKLLCDGELAFGGEGEACERKRYVYPGQGVCWRQGEAGRKEFRRSRLHGVQTQHALYVQDAAMCAVSTLHS